MSDSTPRSAGARPLAEVLAYGEAIAALDPCFRRAPGPGFAREDEA